MAGAGGARKRKVIGDKAEDAGTAGAGKQFLLMSFWF